jgi:magnesium chelatase subunit D
LDHSEPTPAQDAALAAAMLAVDPFGLGGAVLRGRSGGMQESWLAGLQELVPDGLVTHRLPTHATDDRLLGGLDLTATLAAGRPLVERGILARANEGILLVPSAERLTATTAAKIVGTMDTGEVRIERDGLAQQHATRFSVIALDEGIDDEKVPAALRDRLAFHLDLDAFGDRYETSDFTPEDIERREPDCRRSFGATKPLVSSATSRLPLALLRLTHRSWQCGQQVAALHFVAAPAIKTLRTPRASYWHRARQFFRRWRTKRFRSKRSLSVMNLRVTKSNASPRTRSCKTSY